MFISLIMSGSLAPDIIHDINDQYKFALEIMVTGTITIKK